MHGRGTVLLPGEAAFSDLRSNFPELGGVRSLIHVDITRISDACGYGVPLFQFVSNRDQLEKSYAVKGEAGLAAYLRQRNATSINGLSGLDAPGSRDEIA
jgi:hypothetical protein